MYVFCRTSLAARFDRSGRTEREKYRERAASTVRQESFAGMFPCHCRWGVSHCVSRCKQMALHDEINRRQRVIDFHAGNDWNSADRNRFECFPLATEFSRTNSMNSFNDVTRSSTRDFNHRALSSLLITIITPRKNKKRATTVLSSTTLWTERHHARIDTNLVISGNPFLAINAQIKYWSLQSLEETHAATWNEIYYNGLHLDSHRVFVPVERRNPWDEFD